MEEALPQPWPTPTADLSSIEHRWQALHDDWRYSLERYLRFLGLSEDDALDVAQETFFALLRHLHDGKPDGNLRAWVFRVGANLARRRFRGAPHLNIEGLTLSDSRPSPEVLAIHRHAHAQIARIFRALPETDQNCLLLRAEGLSYREIAAALEIPLGKVAQCLARALSRLSVATKGGRK